LETNKEKKKERAMSSGVSSSSFLGYNFFTLRLAYHQSMASNEIKSPDWLPLFKLTAKYRDFSLGRSCGKKGENGCFGDKC
jgi:hypothetical protein